MDDPPPDYCSRYYLSGLADHEIAALSEAGVDGSLLLAMLEDGSDGHRALLFPRDQVLQAPASVLDKRFKAACQCVSDLRTQGSALHTPQQCA
jgi:hypothetical protein